MILSVALLQIDITFGDPVANEEKVERKFASLKEKKVDVVVLPELWTTGYDLTRLEEIADSNGERSLSFLSRLAQKYDVHLVAGSVAKRTERGVTNSMFVINSNGELVKEYAKAHLFRLMEEEKHLVEGSENGIFELAGIKSAGVICYDIRFPEWIRTHMLDNTKVLYVVAEWPAKRIDHWKALLISRAIENQCYVVACNRVGADPNNQFGGHSMIVGPWGEILEEADDEETILYSELDVEQVDDVRQRIPIFSDRRPDIYRY
ncbi:carbon-nitrogen family hydrolase [Oceanobacillus jordanicus]|uniref:Carbon-nitrogen family hydrolase n=1 Tax=Oceanobacillus jordanicus TaxID=2867266 RepID=A0AAW5BEW6_9BACI|nr:carbon-nitrogen family hydrolase [Oceanobacillus jordanicus]MCG3420947.1 carbon-nitrogen family hydrolase [Oceanobacillus jordanicus]